MIETKTLCAVTVRPDCSLLVQETLAYLKDGVQVSVEPVGTYDLAPGDSLEGKPAEAVRIATALCVVNDGSAPASRRRLPG